MSGPYYTLPGIPSDLLSTEIPDERQFKTLNFTNGTETDIAFIEGRKFRAHFELNLAAGATRVLKFTLGTEIDLMLSLQDIDDGGIRYEVYGAGPIEGGSFSVNIPVNRLNNKASAPKPASAVTITTGGTLNVAGFTPADLVRIRTAGANAQRQTVGGIQGSPRGFPATTAYVVITTLDGVNQTSRGVIKYEWIEAKE